MRKTSRTNRGFSLVELMIAMAITLGMSAIVFNLFIQNQNVFRDQTLILEMQQSARAVASIMAEEIRMAGQGVPTYASSWDAAPSEATQVLLSGTGANQIIFRAGIQAGDADLDAGQLDFTSGPTTFNVESADVIANMTPATPDYAFVWGKTNFSWSWVRSAINNVNTGADTIQLTLDSNGDAGAIFTLTPTKLFAEEIVAYRLTGSNIERAQSVDDLGSDSLPDLTNGDYQIVGNNFNSLAFAYYDAAGTAVTITSLADRASVRRIDFTLVNQTSQPLPSSGQNGTFEITMSVYPRNILFY